MALDPRTPVLIGCGQIAQHVDRVDRARDPSALMAQAVELAVLDAAVPAMPQPRSVRAVAQLSWRYGDVAAVVAGHLGWHSVHTAVTPMGGDAPQALVNATAAEIQAGDLDVAVLVGGECARTRARAKRDGVTLDWPVAPADATPEVIGAALELNHAEEIRRGLVPPVQIYPMFESAIRAAAGRSVADHEALLGRLWARFSDVAATNPHAWSHTVLSGAEVLAVTPANRMIGLPYRKVMNSNNRVDMAAALLLCSAERAAALGVPRSRWVFPLAGSGCHEHQFVSNRWSFAETPAVAAGAAAAITLAGLHVDDIELLDLYSCFPSAVQLGAASLGVGLDRQLTRTGGLPFAGGPWNNYSMHAIATVMDELRAGAGRHGLVWANGGYATKHAFGVYATEPPAAGFRWESPQAEVDRLPRRQLALPADAAGPARIDAYTVMFDRSGTAERAIASCLLEDGRRAWGTSDAPDVASAMCNGEWVGRAVTLTPLGSLEL